MSADNISVLQLPWVENSSDKQFLKILLVFMLVFSVLTVVVARITLPELTRAEKEKLPPQLARVVMEQKIIPPQPVTPPKVEEKQITEKPPEKTNEEKSAPVIKEDIKLIQPDTQTSNNDDATVKARNTAKRSGLLAIANELNELQNTDAIAQNARADVISTTSESATHTLETVAAATIQPGKTINQDDVVEKIQATELQTRNTQTKTAATEKAALADANMQQKSGSGGRAPADIGLVFNKNKAGLHSLYERERRKNSSLKGKIVFQLTIEPNGKVSSVKILSSELNNPELESRIIARIKMFIFTQSSGNPVTIDYPVEFIPS